MTTLERANQIVDNLRTKAWCGPAQRADIIEVVGDLVHDAANLTMRCEAQAAMLVELRAQAAHARREADAAIAELAALRASIVEAMSGAGPQDSEG